MSRRISHSVLDPFVGPRLAALYPRLNIPRWFPPEGIVLIGHFSAIVAAIGFAFSAQHGWGGVLGCCGVLGNHFADCLDGTHARATGQCRNGGELLDHFTDPLSFAYILIGMAVGCGRLDLGLAAVCSLFSMAVLTNIKAKMTDEFVLSSFGPTELKATLATTGLLLALGTTHWFSEPFAEEMLSGGYWLMVIGGIATVVIELIRSVREVNASDAAVDTQPWITRAEATGFPPVSIPSNLTAGQTFPKSAGPGTD